MPKSAIIRSNSLEFGLDPTKFPLNNEFFGKVGNVKKGWFFWLRYRGFWNWVGVGVGVGVGSDQHVMGHNSILSPSSSILTWAEIMSVQVVRLDMICQNPFIITMGHPETSRPIILWYPAMQHKKFGPNPKTSSPFLAQYAKPDISFYVAFSRIVGVCW